MKKLFYTLLVLFLSLMTFSCNMGAYWFVFGQDVEDRVSSLKVLDSPSSVTGTTGSVYSILVITDPHFGSDRADQDIEAFYEWFDSQLKNSDETLRPRFMICLGDILDGGHKGEADDFNEFADTLAQMASAAGISGFTTYSILGNHDLYNYGWDVWKENINPGTSFYKFTTHGSASDKGMSWYFLDTANGTLGDRQLELLQEEMEEDSLPKIVSMHYPLYCGGIIQLSIQNALERNTLMSLFAKNNVKLVMEGHAHRSKHYDSGSFEEHLISSFLYSRAFSLITVDENSGSVLSHPDLEY
ncbi:metallophosphoesterase [Treponema sp.]|uniref:metallophosphoesterase family protein n=1 Tax=Treponema sp. TaxID=166 RepID=UPI0025E99C40|nr:metallophosphoesterase [Treponema sp.]MCR5218995.1 metallophosphoesterase [Treponema sp.]